MKTSAIGAIVWLFIVVVGAIGYVKNIVKFAQCDFEAPYKTEIIRGAAIPLGYGFIIGHFDIGEEKK